MGGKIGVRLGPKVPTVALRAAGTSWECVARRAPTALSAALDDRPGMPCTIAGARAGARTPACIPQGCAAIVSISSSSASALSVRVAVFVA